MHQGKPYIIDCGQAMVTEHPNSLAFLERDVKNINRYFAGLGVDVWNEGTVLRYVLGVKRQ
jgi:RIO kinase 1